MSLASHAANVAEVTKLHNVILHGTDQNVRLAQHQLVLQYRPYIINTAKGFVRKYSLNPRQYHEKEVVAELMVEAYRRVLDFDPSRNTVLPTYLSFYLKLAVESYVGQMAYDVSLSGSMVAKMNRVKASIYRLSKESLNKIPTTEAIQVATNVKCTTVEFFRKKENLPQEAFSLDAPVGGLEGDSSLTFKDLLVSKDQSAYDILQIRDSFRLLYQVVESVLSEREKKIVLEFYLTSYDKDRATLESIGSKYGLSRERIRQIIVVAVEKMQAHFKVRGLTADDLLLTE